jgi:L-serine dehydratase
MHAARLFALSLEQEQMLDRCHRVTAELFGSLGATGAGHGSPKAIILGLEGETPNDVDIGTIDDRIRRAREEGQITLLGSRPIAFSYRDDLMMHRTETLPFHSNGMRFSALDESGQVIHSRIYYSVGGGFVVDESANDEDAIVDDPTPVAYPFSTCG